MSASNFPIQVLQEGGEVLDQTYQQRIKMAAHLQSLVPHFMRGVPLGQLAKKKKKPEQVQVGVPQQGMQFGGNVGAGMQTMPPIFNPGIFPPGMPPGMPPGKMPPGIMPPGIFSPIAMPRPQPAPRARPQAGSLPPRYQEGGNVGRQRNTDTVPLMATPGEHVMNLGAVEIAGRPFLNYLNELGKSHPAMMQEGGPVNGSRNRMMFPIQYQQ